MPSVRSIRKASDRIMMMKVISKAILPTCCAVSMKHTRPCPNNERIDMVNVVLWRLMVAC